MEKVVEGGTRIIHACAVRGTGRPRAAGNRQNRRFRGLIKVQPSVHEGRSAEPASPEADFDFRVSRDQQQVVGVFAADVYLTLIEHGFVNIDWLELHNGSFLSEWEGAGKGPAYNGIQMAHHVASAGDALVAATSSREDRIVAHAADRADGSVGVMLLNTHVNYTAVVSVEISGRALASAGVAYHYRPVGLAENGSVVGPETTTGLGSSFVVEVPAYSVADLIIPAAE